MKKLVKDLKCLRGELAAIADGDIEFDSNVRARLEHCAEALNQHADLLDLRDAVAAFLKISCIGQHDYDALRAAYNKVK